jgi:hypothetical protein
MKDTKILIAGPPSPQQLGVVTKVLRNNDKIWDRYRVCVGGGGGVNWGII